MLDYSYENDAHAKGFSVVCGVDEAGRGPLAGPVFAAAVILPEGYVPYSNVPSHVGVEIHADNSIKHLIDPTLIEAVIDFSFVKTEGVHIAPVKITYNTGIVKKGVIDISPKPLTVRVGFAKES